TTRSPRPRCRPCWTRPPRPGDAHRRLPARGQPMANKPALTCLALAALLATAGCTDREAQRQAQAEAEAREREQAAARLQQDYERAVTAGNWELARVHGAALLAQYPGTPAAAAVEPG